MAPSVRVENVPALCRPGVTSRIFRQILSKEASPDICIYGKFARRILGRVQQLFAVHADGFGPLFRSRIYLIIQERDAPERIGTLYSSAKAIDTQSADLLSHR